MWKRLSRWLTIGAVALIAVLGGAQLVSAAAEILERDENRVPVAGGATDDANLEVRNLRVSASSNRLLVEELGSDAGGFTEFYTNRKAVTTAGTPVQLPSKAVQDGMLAAVKAMNANTDTIFVASSSSGALNTSSVSFRLEPGESLAIHADNFDRLWIDADVSGEGVELIML